MLRRLSLAALTLPIALTTAARAGTLATGPTYVKPGEFINCELVNLGTKAAREALVEVIRFDFGPNETGSVVMSSTPEDLGPLGLRGSGLMNEGAGALFACRFSAKGNVSALRGTALLNDGGLTILDSQSAR